MKTRDDFVFRSRLGGVEGPPKFPFKLFGCGFGLFGFVFFAFIMLFFGAILWNAGGGNQMVAEKAAKEYATHVPDVTSIQCNRLDTDADSYVTCTLFRGQQKPMQIECGFSGCRMPKLLVPQE